MDPQAEVNKISNTYFNTYQNNQEIDKYWRQNIGGKTQKQTSTKYQIHISSHTKITKRLNSKTLNEKYWEIKQRENMKKIYTYINNKH